MFEAKSTRLAILVAAMELGLIEMNFSGLRIK
jgi:hypothetical protein